jgi:uncharacterized protein with HEPN domain
MRRDRERLRDIIEALDSLEHIVAGTTEAEFLSSDLHYHAVAQLLTVVGEAASRVSTEMRERCAEVEWRNIVGLRNVLVHQYFGVLRPMVWEVATTEARSLRQKIARMLEAGFTEE